MGFFKIQNPETKEISKFEFDDEGEVIDGTTPEIRAKNIAKEDGYTVLMDMVNRKTGETESIDENMMDQKIKEGYVIPQLDEAKKAQEYARGAGYEAAEWEAPLYGAAESTTFGAAPALMGAVEVLKGGDYEEGRKRFADRTKAVQSQHPFKFAAGGILASLPAATASAGLSLGKQALIGAAPAAVELVSQPLTEESIKQGVVNAVVGGILGAGFAGLGRTASGISNSKAIQDTMDSALVSAVGKNLSKAKDEIKNLPNVESVLRKFNINGEDTYSKVSDALKKVSPTIETIENVAEESAKKTGSIPGINPKSVIGKLELKLKEYVDGGHTEKAATMEKIIKDMKSGASYQDVVEKVPGKTVFVQDANYGIRTTNIPSEKVVKQGSMSLKQARDKADEFADNAYSKRNGAVLDEVGAKVFADAKDIMSGSISEFVGTHNPGALDDFSRAMSEYHVLKTTQRVQPPSAKVSEPWFQGTTPTGIGSFIPTPTAHLKSQVIEVAGKAAKSNIFNKPMKGIASIASTGSFVLPSYLPPLPEETEEEKATREASKRKGILGYKP